MKELLLSRKFWVSFLMLLLVIISAFVPTFEMDTDQAAGFALIIVPYVIGVAVDPGPGGWKGVIQSRKFWAAVVGLTVLFLNGFGLILPMGFTPDQLILIAATFGTYIAGVALEKPKSILIESTIVGYSDPE